MSKPCCNLGDCDESRCDCDAFEKMENEQTKRSDIEKGIVFGLLLVGLGLAIIL